ncbi:hypothetical protein M3936_08740 [Sutcliffiella horikoshii]|uniref:hypothetical protein n=1 Tax=Sutcliffiella horikoshii TaxID=79883 RepID=UPI0020425424|nr:hypothetical protein [Sutcliffiella horikoshii]MCM3617666.1 hypothetical protein [Sutcliffiella horikoshii]
MKRKSVITLGVVGILALTIGFTNVLAKGQTNIEDGDKTRVVTLEEQKMSESNKSIESGDLTTVITAEEQNMVENSLDLEGFVPQEKGTGFFFKKVN